MHTRTSLANRALDLVGKDELLDLDTDTTPLGRFVQRNFDIMFRFCIRRGLWPWAIKRLSLTASATAPVNEYSYAYDLPEDFGRVIKIWPDNVMYKREQDQILTDEPIVTLKYISYSATQDPSIIDIDFAEYFCHMLAVALCYKVTDSVQLKQDLREEANTLFGMASAIFSQEDIDDPMPESPWVSDRIYDGLGIHDTIRITGLE
jgi:hypothetical protein